MVRILLIFSFVFLMSSPVSFAAHGDGQVQSLYGKDLTHAPFFLRFAFANKYGKDWKDSTYEERSKFLRDYQASLVKEQAQERQEARDEAMQEKERLTEKIKEQREQKARLAAEMVEEKADEDDYNQRQIEFSKTIEAEQKEIAQMQQDFTEAKASESNR